MPKTPQKTDVELAQERRAADRAHRNALDELLIQNARKSPEQIEAATGVPAAEAMERLALILRTRDWMSERMEERLLMIEMGDLIDDVKKRLANVSEQYYSDTANVALRGYEAISKRMDARRSITEEDMAEITRVYQHYLTRGWDWANSVSAGADSAGRPSSGATAPQPMRAARSHRFLSSRTFPGQA